MTFLIPLLFVCESSALQTTSYFSTHSSSITPPSMDLRSKHLQFSKTNLFNQHNNYQALRTTKLAKLMAVEGDFDTEAISRDVSLSQSGSLKGKFRALYKFTRPHTIRGTILASIAGTIRALVDAKFAVFDNTSWIT